ncbi:E3 ubiquitin-protein ligase TRIM71-like [Watersipora subatra]|uniref:E3 ubiquitin-protein ligase TRIM71-like n=1 Tax=Watersipora subatra TaxID=2589382 RepID=UPI00355BE9EE
MADLQLSEDYRCGYCYKQFNSMDDPKELPCHHVFCKTCLEEDYSVHGNIRCRSCLTEYEMEEFDELPKANLNTKDNITTTSLTCDCDNCDGQVAASYCIDCAVKICDTHQQIHNSLLSKMHKTISISTYQLHPGIYKKVMCKQHGGDVIEVCDKCQLPVCIRCDRKEGSCQGTLTDHTFSSLNTMKEEITAHFNKLLQSASEKLTEICMADKEIWKVLDEEEVECAKRIQMIERVRDKQIEAIGEESEKLMEQIYEYQRDLTDQVQSYNTGLLAKKERLEKSCSEVRKWLRESHVIEKVEQRQQMTAELVNNTDVMIDCPLTKTPALINTELGTLYNEIDAEYGETMSKDPDFYVTDDLQAQMSDLNDDAEDDVEPTEGLTVIHSYSTPVIDSESSAASLPTHPMVSDEPISFSCKCDCINKFDRTLIFSQLTYNKGIS